MAIRGTKYMHETGGSAENAGTSDSVLNLPDVVLDAAGTNVHAPNHGHMFVVGDALNIYDQEDDGGATEGVYEVTAVTDDDFTITPAAGNSVRTIVSVNVGGPWNPGYPAFATGSSNMSESFGLDEPWTLVSVYCHFALGAGNADLVFSLDSILGSAYDVTVFTLEQVGSSKEATFRLGTPETGAPSAWHFQKSDLVKFAWTNPDDGVMAWGLRVGMLPTRLLEDWG